MRVQITPRCVGWVEQEIQAWISEQIAARTAFLMAKGSPAPRRAGSRTAIT
jgi:Prophage CP4-57 regulatory protein (AlpA)